MSNLKSSITIGRAIHKVVSNEQIIFKSIGTSDNLAIPFPVLSVGVLLTAIAHAIKKPASLEADEQSWMVALVWEQE